MITAQVLQRDKVITHVTAQHYNIGCVRKEVSRLRSDGWNIVTKRTKDLNGKSYTRWELIA